MTTSTRSFPGWQLIASVTLAVLSLAGGLATTDLPLAGAATAAPSNSAWLHSMDSGGVVNPTGTRLSDNVNGHAEVFWYAAANAPFRVRSTSTQLILEKGTRSGTSWKFAQAGAYPYKAVPTATAIRAVPWRSWRFFTAGGRSFLFGLSHVVTEPVGTSTGPVQYITVVEINPNGLVGVREDWKNRTCSHPTCNVEGPGAGRSMDFVEHYVGVDGATYALVNGSGTAGQYVAKVPTPTTYFVTGGCQNGFAASCFPVVLNGEYIPYASPLAASPPEPGRPIDGPAGTQGQAVPAWLRGDWTSAVFYRAGYSPTAPNGQLFLYLLRKSDGYVNVFRWGDTGSTRTLLHSRDWSAGYAEGATAVRVGARTYLVTVKPESGYTKVNPIGETGTSAGVIGTAETTSQYGMTGFWGVDGFSDGNSAWLVYQAPPTAPN
jgi:hypothetical protein